MSLYFGHTCKCIELGSGSRSESGSCFQPLSLSLSLSLFMFLSLSMCVSAYLCLSVSVSVYLCLYLYLYLYLISIFLLSVSLSLSRAPDNGRLGERVSESNLLSLLLSLSHCGARPRCSTLITHPHPHAHNLCINTHTNFHSQVTHVEWHHRTPSLTFSVFSDLFSRALTNTHSKRLLSHFDTQVALAKCDSRAFSDSARWF